MARETKGGLAWDNPSLKKKGEGKKIGERPNYHRLMALLYVVGTAAVLYYAKASPDTVARGASRIVEMVKRRPLTHMPVSDRFNLEGRMGEDADNVVRLSSVHGVGTGHLLNPYTILTAHHVVADAAANKVPVYVQSQTYLAEGESVRVDLTADNFRGNAGTDLAEITLTTPFYQAHTMRVERAPDFKADDNIRGFCYRNTELFPLLGHVVAIQPGPPIFYGTDLQGGPGNSGCAVFDHKGDLVGVISMATVPQSGFRTNIDTGSLIFSGAGNPL